MKKFVLTCLLILNFVAFGQSNFDIGFKDGFKKGYCYSNNQSSYICTPPIPPLPPLPQINEKSTSYQDGYNRGFLYGQDRRRTDDNNSSNSNVNRNNPPKFNPYVPQSPDELIVMRGINLQRKFDLRAAWIQNKVDELGALYERLFINQDFQKININNIKDYVRSEHVKFINSLTGADLVNDYIFNKIVNELNSVIENTYLNYNKCVEEENKRR
jgi:hypothetical protein